MRINLIALVLFSVLGIQSTFATQYVYVAAHFPPTEGASSPGNIGLFRIDRWGNGTAGRIQVYLSWSGTASSSDRSSSLPTTVDIFDGVADALINVTIADDSDYEGTETLTCTITGAVNLSFPESIFVPFPQATLDIYDNDKPTVTISAGGTAFERTSPNNQALSSSFTFSRTGITSSALTVYYNFGGSATFGTDFAINGNYYSYSGYVTIPSGSSSASITIDPIQNAVLEGEETVIFNISSNAAYNTGSPSSGTVYIYDQNY